MLQFQRSSWFQMNDFNYYWIICKGDLIGLKGAAQPPLWVFFFFTVFLLCLLYWRQLQEESFISGCKAPYAPISSWFFCYGVLVFFWGGCLFVFNKTISAFHPSNLDFVWMHRGIDCPLYKISSVMEVYWEHNLVSKTRQWWQCQPCLSSH